MGTLASLRRVATIERIGSSTRIEGSRLSDPEVEHLFELCRELKVSEVARLAAYRRLFEDALSAELLQRLRDCAIARTGASCSAPRSSSGRSPPFSLIVVPATSAGALRSQAILA